MSIIPITCPFPPDSNLSALGVFNVLDTQYHGGMAPSRSGPDNALALAAAITAATSAGGGLILIPAGSYSITGPIEIDGGGTTDIPIIVAGTGAGTTLVQTVVPTGSINLFHCTNLMANAKGVRLCDLTLSYAIGSTGGTAVFADAGTQNVTCQNVYFLNCPTAFHQASTALHCGLFNCTIDYQAGPDSSNMVVITGPEFSVKGCVIKQLSQSVEGAPTGCIGIHVEVGASDPYIENTRIVNFDTSVMISGGYPLNAFFTNLICTAWINGIYIKPANEGGNITEILFKNCIVTLASGSLQTTSSGIYLNDNGGTLSDVLFENCMCFGWGGPGLELSDSTNVQVNGGRYGSCGLGVAKAAGISLTGAANIVIIDGVDCSGLVPGGFAKQPYGISITGAVSGVRIHNCNLSNNVHTPGLYVGSGITDVQVTACTGYNDLAATPASSPPLNHTPFQNTVFGYFGPITFYTTGNSSVAINAASTSLGDGGFTLSPGESGTLTYGSGTVTFLASGE